MARATVAHIIHRAGQAPCLRAPLSSNVRLHMGNKAASRLKDASRSIEQLEGVPWPQPDHAAPLHVHRCHALRQVPVEQLTLGDLRALITQDIGLNYLLPIAIPVLQRDPLLEGEYYPGDLLCAAIEVQWSYWSKAKNELANLRKIAERAQSLIGAHSEPNDFRQVSKDLAGFLAKGAA